MIPSFLNTLTWWQWSVLALVPPAILALYFLKLKRTRLEVPSTYLWHKSIEELHVNSIWQRLRRNLLLLFQLLVVFLAMAALLRPGWRGATLVGNRFVFLVDQSASMAATDVRPSRLDEAKRRVRALIDGAPAGAQAMIIGFADSAQVVQEFTDNRPLLRQRLETIEPTARPTALLPALQLAAGLANPGRIATEAGDLQVADARPATLYLFSDGKFAQVQDFSLGNLTPVFVPVGRSDADNVAITAFSTRRSEAAADQVQAFGRLENMGRRRAAVTVSLLVDGMLTDADQVTLAPGSSRGLVFNLGDLTASALRLEISPSDALRLDNAAYAAINVPRRGRVLWVSPGNEAVRPGLSTRRARQLVDVEVATPDTLTTQGYQERASSGYYDLVIYDQCRPSEMPQANTLWIGRVPPLDRWHGTGTAPPNRVSGPQVIDIDREHPIMQMVELGGILIGESMALAPPSGSTTLVDSNRGILCAIAPRQAFEDLVLGFEIVHTTVKGQRFNTDWPLGRLSFPVFLLNVLNYLGGGQTASGATAARPGAPIELPSDSSADALQVVTPGGATQRVTRDRDGTFRFFGTDRPGIYQVRGKTSVTRRFAVNLFDRAESDIRTRPDAVVQIGYVDIAGRAGWEPARRETWKFLLLVALAVLLVEWYIYSCRVAL